MKASREFLRLIEASLVEQIGDWSANRFEIVNSKRGITIWMGIIYLTPEPLSGIYLLVMWINL